ncbi:hypothetical protein D3C85_1558320 [compost metagenome]
MRGIGQCTDVGDAEHGVGGAFQPEEIGLLAVVRADEGLHGIRIRDVHRAQFQETLLCQLRGHDQGPRVAVRWHDNDAACRYQGECGADGRQTGGVQQAREGGAFQLGEGVLERVPRGVGVPSVAAVSVA